MNSALLWFRRDLRLHDHPALAAAAQNEDVLACFVFDPRLEASSSRRRLQYLGDSLRQLRGDLGGRLLVTRGRPAERIPRIAKEISATSVHISHDFGPFGRRRDERVRAALGSVPLVATGSPYLVSPGRVTKQDGTPYQVFTPFLRKWGEVGWRPPARSGPESARWQWGAEWFLDQLVDGDIANNQHGWQWCAGCGTDAAPYFRVFNPNKQGEKFDPSGDYIRRWVPELGPVEDVHLRKGERPAGYPAPIVDHAAERSEALRRYHSI